MPPSLPEKNDRALRVRRTITGAPSAYPLEAFEFVQCGLAHTVRQTHGPTAVNQATTCRHVTGRQLCLGLREYAYLRWGRLAGIVLARWNLTSTLDFGKIVFSLVDAGVLKTTEQDSIEDFRDVYDFGTFDSDYQILCNR
jgi:uncharacterized repeat protein (TIGR04138 family)